MEKIKVWTVTEELKIPHDTPSARMMMMEELMKIKIYSENPLKRFLQKIGILKTRRLMGDDYLKIVESWYEIKRN